MTYNIEISRTAEKFLEKLSKEEKKCVKDAIDDLSENPRPYGYIKLKNRKDEYRIPTGTCRQYRIIYTINDKKILIYILTIADRKDVYKKK